MLDLKDLRCFIAVYETRGFGRAAKTLNTVQSNISDRIRRLENEVGTSLFDRLHRSIRPTPKGEVLYRYAVKVLQDISEMEAAIIEQRVA